MSSHEVRRHNETVLKSLEPGDLVQFDRGAYNHWAVYVGDNKVVHLSGGAGPIRSNSKHSGALSGQELNKGTVCEDGFWEVVEDNKAYKNNSKDKKMRHLEPSEIVTEAKTNVGKKGYNLFFKNCEHFASWCRYKVAQSDQADGLLAGLVAAVTSVVVGLGVGFVAWFRGGKEKDKEKEAMY